MKRKICFVTGTRAEYGILKPLMDEINKDKRSHLQIIATGMHLSRDFGLTYREIEKDGFTIDKKVDICLKSDTPDGISKSMGYAMIGFASAYRDLKPDMIIVLGDRFEIFSAVACAHVHGIPVVHLHGGEVTEGAFDDAFRHCITKMSYLHFTATEEYRRRVIQLGESPDRVFNVGAIGLDNIRTLKLLSKPELEKRLDLKFKRHNILVTFHPVTLEQGTAQRQFQTLLSVLDELKDTQFVFTKANADTDGRKINTMIDTYIKRNKDRAMAFTSLGQINYLSVMAHVDAVAGNSSSGIVEAPSLKIGTINIGDRQKGRLRAKSIIDCSPERKSIQWALKKLYSERFQKQLQKVINPYGGGCTAKKIARVIKRYPWPIELKKGFFDVKKGRGLS